MEDYFAHVVKNLGLDEMTILGLLQTYEADMSFKALKRSTLLEESKMTLAHFRKSLDKLDALGFVSVKSGKENLIHITEYGVDALNTNLEGVID